MEISGIIERRREQDGLVRVLLVKEGERKVDVLLDGSAREDLLPVGGEVRVKGRYDTAGVYHAGEIGVGEKKLRPEYDHQKGEAVWKPQEYD